MKKSPVAKDCDELVKKFLAEVNQRSTNISAVCERIPVGRTSFYACLDQVYEGEVRENHVALMRDFLQASEGVRNANA